MSLDFGPGPAIAVPQVPAGGYSPGTAIVNSVIALMAGQRARANSRAAAERQAVQTDYTRALTEQVRSKLQPQWSQNLDVRGVQVPFTDPNEYATQARLLNPDKPELVDFDADAAAGPGWKGGPLGKYKIKPGTELTATIALRRLQQAEANSHRLSLKTGAERSPVPALSLATRQLEDEERRIVGAETGVASQVGDALRRSALLDVDEQVDREEVEALRTGAAFDRKATRARIARQVDEAQAELGIDPGAFRSYQEGGKAVAARLAAEGFAKRTGERWSTGARERLARKRRDIEAQTAAAAGLPQEAAGAGPSDAFLEFQEILRQLQE